MDSIAFLQFSANSYYMDRVELALKGVLKLASAVNGGVEYFS